MFTDYDGADVFDTEGNKVGTVERTFVDDAGTSRLVEVKLGSLFAKHRLVPVEDAEVGDKGIQVPFSKAVIEDSPDASHIEDSLEGDLLDRVRGYYNPGSGDGTSEETEDADLADRSAAADRSVAARPITEDGSEDEDTAGDTDRATGIVERQPGTVASHVDTADVPTSDSERVGDIRDLGDIIEIPIVEEELVKRPVVKEVLRIRKTSGTETQSVGSDVRREDVEVTKTGNVEAITDET